MSAPKGADITDAETRSALVLLFKQFVLATPKTRSLTITIGDIKITSPPVQHTHWQAARGQPDPRRFSSGQQQRHRVLNAKQRRSANRAAERAGQPPPYPKPSMAKEEQGRLFLRLPSLHRSTSSFFALSSVLQQLRELS